jgi:hypothetical protein
MPHPSGLRSANSLNTASSLPGFSGDELHIVKGSHIAYYAILSALIPNSSLRRTISPSGTTGVKVSSTAKPLSQIGHILAFIVL